MHYFCTGWCKVETAAVWYFNLILRTPFSENADLEIVISDCSSAASAPLPTSDSDQWQLFWKKSRIKKSL